MKTIRFDYKTKLYRFSWAFLCLAFSFVLSGCANIDVGLEFEKNDGLHELIINQTTDQFADVDVLFIDDAVKNYIDTVVLPADSAKVRVGKLQQILFGQEYLNIQYSDERTHTAMETYNERQGNCVSVMNLYIAMARYVGVHAVYQTVEVKPEWDRRGDFLVLSQHINATGKFNSRTRYVVDFTPEVALQEITAKEITDTHARALYFSNLGVEALVRNDIEGAVSYFKNALFLDENLSIVWSNIGSSFNWLGEFALAEYSYQMAFHTDPSYATPINNLARFYENQGDAEKAKSYRLAVNSFNKQNPYFHFSQGMLQLEQDEFEKAIVRFRRAIRLNKQEPDFYLALAQTHAELGEPGKAQKYLTIAKQVDVSNQRVYLPGGQKVRIIDSSGLTPDVGPKATLFPSRN